MEVKLPSMGLKVGDKFPESALQKFGVDGTKSVLFFYGADDAPSCSKEISAFDAAATRRTSASPYYLIFHLHPHLYMKTNIGRISHLPYLPHST